VAPRASSKQWREHGTAPEVSPSDILLVNDHSGGLGYAPMEAKAAVAQLTDRIRLGVLVLARDYRPSGFLNHQWRCRVESRAGGSSYP